MILVCSAIKGCTDNLLRLQELDGREKKELLDCIMKSHSDIVTRLFTGSERKDALRMLEELRDELEESRPEEYVTFGELLSTRIISEKLRCDGFDAVWLDSRKLISVKNGKLNFKETEKRILSETGIYGSASVFVAPGFIASDETGRPTTLGRGGSDYSAAIYAAAVNADRLEIWTDVPGIMTANPKDVPSAGSIPSMSYTAAFELAAHGAKVLYAPSVGPAREKGISINIKDTFLPDHPGTEISGDPRGGEWIAVSVASESDEFSTLCLAADGNPDFEKASARVASVLAGNGITAGKFRKEGFCLLFDVRRGLCKEALKAVHYDWFESSRPEVIPVYIAGNGKVAEALRAAISKDKRIRVCGISDSRNFIINNAGINELWVQLPKPNENDGYVDAVIANAVKGAVFIDCTDSETIYRRFTDLFEAGVNVISSNRRSLAVPFAEFAAMKASAMENKTFFRYGTTVGAALPMLHSLEVSAAGNDRITGIEAVVSCTLNHLMEEIDKGADFADVLEDAQKRGLTEKDPRADLGGKDALRKLLILAREAGVPLDEEDVEVKPVLDGQYFNCGVNEFYTLLRSRKPGFEKNLRFIARLDEDKASPKGYRASVSLCKVSEDHPAYRMHGTDNAIMIRSAFHPSPLVIQGAGEGADLAAAGIMLDLIKNIQ